MDFYIDIAKPARDRALKQIQAQTEEPYVSDPMFAVERPAPTPNFQASMPGGSPLPLATQGFGVNPEDPFATTGGGEFIPGFSSTGTDAAEAYRQSFRSAPEDTMGSPEWQQKQLQEQAFPSEEGLDSKEFFESQTVTSPDIPEQFSVQPTVEEYVSQQETDRIKNEETLYDPAKRIRELEK